MSSLACTDALAVLRTTSLQPDAQVVCSHEAYQRATSRADSTAMEVLPQQASMLSSMLPDGLLTDSDSCVSVRPTDLRQVMGKRMNLTGGLAHLRISLRVAETVASRAPPCHYRANGVVLATSLVNAAGPGG